MSVILDGVAVDVPGIKSVSWLEDSSLRLGREDGRRRPAPYVVRAVVLHTTQGFPDSRHPTPQSVIERPATERELRARRTIARWQEHSETSAGAALVLDADAVLYCGCDLIREVSFHAGVVNSVTLGIEIVQQPDASLHRAQIDAVPVLCGWLADTLKIPRRVAHPYRGRPREGISDELGFYGHRDVTRNRGAGDPGDFVIGALLAAGWEPF